MTTISHGCQWCEAEFSTVNDLTDHLLIGDHRNDADRHEDYQAEQHDARGDR